MSRELINRLFDLGNVSHEDGFHATLLMADGTRLTGSLYLPEDRFVRLDLCRINDGPALELLPAIVPLAAINGGWIEEA